MTKIFLTGATGYIGGDALHAIASSHPEYEITALVRNSDKGAVVAKDYPSVRMVYGDLDDEDILAEQSMRADIVCHFAHADHEGAIRAILSGLAKHDAASPGFLIHTSGTGSLMFHDLRAGTYGESSEHVYDDIRDVDKLKSLPDDAPHRHVDKVIQQAGAEYSDRVKTAIVSPPLIYGRGRGPGNQRSIQLPELCRETINAKAGLYVNGGKARWSNIHVHDLAALYVRLVEEAASGGLTSEWPEKPVVWGANGIFFCENGEEAWSDVARYVAAEAHKQGLIPEAKVKSIAPDEAQTLATAGRALWGTNSRSRASRAREALKWTPQAPSMIDTIAETLELEAKVLGKIKGHAEQVAGTKS